MNRFLLLVALIIFSANTVTAYTVKGTLKNVSSCFYPKVYLAVINDIDQVYTASPDQIIAVSDIDAAGNFVITGNDLPEDMRYYRLYVNSDGNTDASLYVGPQKNYILLVLNNTTDVTVICPDFCADGAVYEVTGSPENQSIAGYQNIISTYTSFMIAHYKTMSPNKKAFVEDKFRKDLMYFSDTSRTVMAGLLAVMEIGIDKTNDSLSAFFQHFGNRLKKEMPSSQYTRQYLAKLKTLPAQQQDAISGPYRIALIFTCILLAGSLTMNVILFRRRKAISAVEQVPELKTAEADCRSLIESLSIKEREILKMIHEGLSNKEIAQKLNVELSTVKTHASRIYQKTGINNRRQVGAIARYL